MLRLLQVMSPQAHPAKKGTEEAAAATTLQALTCAAGDDPFRHNWPGRMQDWLLQLLPGT